eukprot:gene23700-29946_t
MKSASATNNKIISTLTSALSQYFHKMNITPNIVPFGSSANQLGTSEHSDLDLSLSLFHTGTRREVAIESDNTNKKADLRRAEQLRRKNEKAGIKNVPPPKSSGGLKMSKVLHQIEGALARFARGQFKIGEVITRARVPIIKMKHIQSGIEVDICINNRLAVKNTQLLFAYTQFDIRAHKLMLMVKHWAARRANVLPSFTTSLHRVEEGGVVGSAKTANTPHLLKTSPYGLKLVTQTKRTLGEVSVGEEVEEEEEDEDENDSELDEQEADEETSLLAPMEALKCNVCHELGHIGRECPKSRDNWKRENNNRGSSDNRGGSDNNRGGGQRSAGQQHQQYQQSRKQFVNHHHDNRTNETQSATQRSTPQYQPPQQNRNNQGEVRYTNNNNNDRNNSNNNNNNANKYAQQIDDFKNSRGHSTRNDDFNRDIAHTVPSHSNTAPPRSEQRERVPRERLTNTSRRQSIESWRENPHVEPHHRQQNQESQLHNNNQQTHFEQRSVEPPPPVLRPHQQKAQQVPRPSQRHRAQQDQQALPPPPPLAPAPQPVVVHTHQAAPKAKQQDFKRGQQLAAQLLVNRPLPEGAQSVSLSAIESVAHAQRAKKGNKNTTPSQPEVQEVLTVESFMHKPLSAARKAAPSAQQQNADHFGSLQQDTQTSHQPPKKPRNRNNREKSDVSGAGGSGREVSVVGGFDEGAEHTAVPRGGVQGGGNRKDRRQGQQPTGRVVERSDAV